MNRNAANKSSSPPVSRRDWFRLKPPTPKPPTPNHDSLGREASTDLQDVPTPDHSHEPTLTDLPPIHEAILGSEQLQELFADIEHHGSNIQLMVRGASRSSAKSSASSVDALRSACKQLLAGTAVKLQIRYAWQQANWIDTIENKSGQYRLVRMQATV